MRRFLLFFRRFCYVLRSVWFLPQVLPGFCCFPKVLLCSFLFFHRICKLCDVLFYLLDVMMFFLFLSVGFAKLLLFFPGFGRFCEVFVVFPRLRDVFDVFDTVQPYRCIGAHPVLRFHRVSSLSSCVLYARGCTGLWWAHAPLVGGRVTD